MTQPFALASPSSFHRHPAADTRLQELQGVRLGRPRHRVFVKDETRTESGSHKQRAAAAVVLAARAAGHDWLTVGSCGNYGLAIAVEAARVGAAADVVLPGDYATGDVARQLTRLGAQIHRVDGGYEDAVAASKALARREALADANVDGPFASVVTAALSKIAVEITADLADLSSRADVAGRDREPAVTSARPHVTVWVPTGNGTTAAAVAAPEAGLPPASTVVAVTAAGNSSVLASWPGRRHAALPAEGVVSTPAREPLVNWEALHGQAALDALHARRAAGGHGHVLGVTDAHLCQAQAVLAAHGLHVSPSGAAGLAGLLNTQVLNVDAGHATTSTDAVHVVVLTGR